MKNTIEWERIFSEERPAQELGEENDMISEMAEELGLDVQPMPVIDMEVTPWGLLRVDDKNNPIKNFDYWLAHTNFKITEPVGLFLDSCDGVECLEILTPYRFRIAIGRLFDNRKVRMSIESALCGKHKIFTVINSIPYEDVQEKINDAVTAAEEFLYWSVYILPNGAVQYSTFESEEEYNDSLADINKLCMNSGSLVITHEDK